MRAEYTDIRSRIPDAPRWFDEAGVPRYDPFTPNTLANAYAREAALVEILCQECRAGFVVSMSQPTQGGSNLADEITRQVLNYGDPPNVGCCPTGYATTTVPVRVLEYWRRNTAGTEPDWVRDPALEMAVSDQWREWLQSYGLGDE